MRILTEPTTFFMDITGAEKDSASSRKKQEKQAIGYNLDQMTAEDFTKDHSLFNYSSQIATPSVQKKQVQKKASPEEEELQMKSATIQKQGVEEEELQMKKSPVQKMSSPEEEELQMKSSTMQKKGLEEEELQMKESPVQKMSSAKEKELQMKSATMQKHGVEEEELQMKKSPVQNKSGSGSEMPEDVQMKMESSFGTDFSDVNIHANDNSATDMGALAYTQGNDVHFARGQYNPQSQAGQELLGHELTHVVQQRQGRVQATTQQKGVGVNDDPGLEKEADDMGKKAAEGKQVAVDGTGNGIQKKMSLLESVPNQADSKEEVVAEGIRQLSTSSNTVEETTTNPFKLGLTGSVGKDCDNNSGDIEIVRNKLISFGFLDVANTDQANLNEAIGKFQKEVCGFSNPDQKISAGGGTDRALTTYYTAVPSDYTIFEAAINDDFTITSKKAPENFVTTMAGVTINASSTPETVNINALTALQDRLIQLNSSLFDSGFSNVNLKAFADKEKTQFTEEDLKVIKGHIEKTIKAIKQFQKDYVISYWNDKTIPGNSSKYVLSGSASKSGFKDGEIKDGDATFIMLKDLQYHTMSWKTDEGETKELVKRNFVKSGHTKYTEGISEVGSITPGSIDDERFKTASGLNETDAKGLKEASSHEGNFDSINTYDRAMVSYGFIQFAGGNRSIEYLFARIKHNNPDTFQNRFGKYGINVEYKTNASGSIEKKSCRMILHDPGTNKTLRGIEAEEAIKTNIQYSAVLLKAAGDKVVQDEQISCAADEYVKPAKKSKPWIDSVKVLIVNNGNNGKTVKLNATIHKRDGNNFVSVNLYNEIEAFKNTQEYKDANEAGTVTETDLTTSLKSLQLGDIMESEKERAAMFGGYINNPADFRASITEAIIEIIKAKGLSTIDEIKGISPVELLQEAEKHATPIHKKRFKDARESANLAE